MAPDPRERLGTGPAPLMRDYWLAESHGPCAGGCGFLFHELFELYMDDPPAGGPPTGLETAIAQMFAARLTADFALDDLYEYAARPGEDTNYYKARAAIERAPIEASKFRHIANSFSGSLDPAQKSAMAPLAPVAKKAFALEEAMAPLRNAAAHSDMGVHGIIGMAKSTGGEEPELEDKAIKSAHLIGTYVDFAMHQFPACFRHALSKATVGDLRARLSDPGSLPDRIAAFKRANPISPIDFGRVGAKEARTMERLLTIRNALQVVVPAYAHLSRATLGSGRMTRPWLRIQHRKLAYYAQYATLELISFFDLHSGPNRALPVASDDSVARFLRQNETDIRKLRQLAAHWESGRDFAAEVNGGIGYERLILIAALVSEWARINGNEYIERGGLDGVPKPARPNRRLALGRTEHEVGMMRADVRSRMARAAKPGCAP